LPTSNDLTCAGQIELKPKEWLDNEVTLDDLTSAGQTKLTPKEFLDKEVTLRTLKMREVLLKSLLSMYAFLIVCTMVIFFLQGFHIGNFDLEISLLQWLGGATVGEIAGLIGLTITYYLRAGN
jgi:hypothetical protein